MPVAVRPLDGSILAMDLKLGVLITADFAADLLGGCLGLSTMACARSTITLDLPTAILVRHHSVGITCHSRFLSKLVEDRTHARAEQPLIGTEQIGVGHASNVITDDAWIIVGCGELGIGVAR